LWHHLLGRLSSGGPSRLERVDNLRHLINGRYVQLLDPFNRLDILGCAIPFPISFGHVEFGLVFVLFIIDLGTQGGEVK
jgi:hypothetical protein